MKKETLEDIAKWVIEFRITKNEYARVSDFEMYHTIIEKVSKWQQERSYSEKEVLEILKKYEIDNHCQGESYFNSPHIKKWFKNNPFKQFKKK